MPHYSWHEQPAFDTAAYLLSDRRTAVRCVRQALCAHPGLVNCRDRKGRTFLQLAVQLHHDPELIDAVRAPEAISRTLIHAMCRRGAHTVAAAATARTRKMGALRVRVRVRQAMAGQHELSLARDNDGQSALLVALHRNHKAFVRLLLQVHGGMRPWGMGQWGMGHGAWGMQWAHARSS